MASAHRSTSKLENALYRYGSYVAKNQIKVLLLNCIVLSTIVCAVDPFELLPWRRSSFPAWWTADRSLEVSSDPICLKIVPAERQLRMLQMKIARDLGHEHGVVDRGLLHQSLQMEQAVRPLLASGVEDWACLKGGSEECLVSTPSQYWNYSESALLSDAHLLETLSSYSQPYTTKFGVPASLDATFSNIRSAYSFAAYSSDELVSSWLFESEQAGRATKAIQKRNLIRDFSLTSITDAVASLGQIQAVKSKPRQFVIKRRTGSSKIFRYGDKDVSLIFFLGYAVVALYIGYRLKRLDRVHSRSGLLFTAMVSMTGSGLLSLSVCKMLGFSVDSIPWKFIPLLIMVLAADNAMMLSEAVMSTSVERSIPERIGEGLAKVGPSILYALAVEHLLLLFGFLVLPVRSVREMTLLAAIALKADAVMQVTLFLTILSIDIQRLELADLLRQGSSAFTLQSANYSGLHFAHEDSPSAFQETMTQIWNGAQERLARSVTFVAVIAINMYLYARFGKQYFLPDFCSNANGIYPAHPIAALLPESRLWALMNPARKAAVRVIVEAPVYFWPHVFGGLPTPTSFFGYIGYVSLNLLKHVVMPVAFTTLSVYILLLYLLKDKELLEREKERAAKERKARVNALKRQIGPQITGQLINIPSQSDVEALAVSNNAAILSWSVMDNCLTLTRFDRLFKKDASEPVKSITLPLHGIKTAIRHLSLNHDASVCAAANAIGEVSIWSLADREPVEFPPIDSSTETDKKIVLSLFADPRNGGGTPPKNGRSATENASFFALFSDGSLVGWDCLQKSVSTLIPRLEDGEREAAKVFCIHSPPAQHQSWPVIARFTSNQAEFWTCRTKSEWVLAHQIKLSQTTWPVSAVACSSLTFDLEKRTIISIGTSTGRVGLWDADNVELVAEIDSQVDAISKIKIVPASRTRCPCPAEVLCDSFLLIYATASEACVKRCHLPAGTGFCLCPSLVRRSFEMTRSSSAGSVSRGTVEKATTPSLETADGVDYPITPHMLRRATQSNDRRNREVSDSSTLSDTSVYRLAVPRADSPGSVRASSTSTSISPRSSREEMRNSSSEASSVEPHCWGSNLRMNELGTVKVDVNGVWDLLGSYMLGGIRKVASVDSESTEGWELFSVDLSSMKTQLDCITTPITPFNVKMADKDARSSINETQVRQRRHPAEGRSTSSTVAERLPFTRIRCFTSTPDRQHLVVSYGSSIAILSPTIGSKGISPSNDALLAFLTNLPLRSTSTKIM